MQDGMQTEKLCSNELGYAVRFYTRTNVASNRRALCTAAELAEVKFVNSLAEMKEADLLLQSEQDRFSFVDAINDLPIGVGCKDRDRFRQGHFYQLYGKQDHGTYVGMLDRRYIVFCCCETSC